MAQNGLMKGVGVRKFDSYATQGMIMTILARMSGIDTDGGSTWYEKGMTWAVENSVSDGTDPSGLSRVFDVEDYNTFRDDRNLSWYEPK